MVKFNFTKESSLGFAKQFLEIESKPCVMFKDIIYECELVNNDMPEQKIFKITVNPLPNIEHWIYNEEVGKIIDDVSRRIMSGFKVEYNGYIFSVDIDTIFIYKVNEDINFKHFDKYIIDTYDIREPNYVIVEEEIY
jgi:hypothetical protein